MIHSDEMILGIYHEDFDCSAESIPPAALVKPPVWTGTAEQIPQLAHFSIILPKTITPAHTPRFFEVSLNSSFSSFFPSTSIPFKLLMQKRVLVI